MTLDVAAIEVPERDFAQMVDALDELPTRQFELIALLSEAHHVYRQRSASAVARMRGWTLLAIARQPLPDAAMVYILEEFETGRSPYSVACAARALRSAPSPTPTMAIFLLHAAANIRGTDDYVDLVRYGGVADDDGDATAFSELMVTLRWLGGAVAGVADIVEASLKSNDHLLSHEQIDSVTDCLAATRADRSEPSSCCGAPEAWSGLQRWVQRGSIDLSGVEFEDQDGLRVRYNEFFFGQPSFVVFFYTRCDNEGKCSLTVTKLARVQVLLDAAGMSGRVRTAAITYDPEYDLSPRLRGYAESRGVKMSANSRVMRAVTGAASLRAYFELGVNFIESLVNRHRIEAFLLDDRGAITASFVRLQWSELRVVAEILKLAERCEISHDGNEKTDATATTPVDSVGPRSIRSESRRMLAPVLYVAMALLPKCPICGAAYVSVSGIMALPQLPSVYWLVPALTVLSVVNLISLWWLAQTSRDWSGFVFALVGATITIGWGIALDCPPAAAIGGVVTLAGSVLGVWRGSTGAGRRRARRYLSFAAETLRTLSRRSAR
ncbi:SCO family protein [Variovorax paradoxus]|nr:SCO family protein [Variovorax paradoxus]